MKKKPPKQQAEPVDPKVVKQIQDAAMFISDMIQQSPPAVQTAALAVALSSLIIVQVKVGKRIKVLDRFVEDMRHHIIQANSKKAKT